MDKEDSIYHHRSEELLANCPTVDVSNPDSRKQQITHIAKAGETVVSIANLYGVTTANLRRWNSLSGRRVPAGRKLKLFVDNGGVAFPQTVQTKLTKPTETTETRKTQESKETKEPGKTENRPDVYIVKSGDSLYTIATKYPGVSVKDLQEANGLTTTNIRPGQKIKIPYKG